MNIYNSVYLLIYILIRVMGHSSSLISRLLNQHAHSPMGMHYSPSALVVRRHVCYPAGLYGFFVRASTAVVLPLAALTSSQPVHKPLLAARGTQTVDLSSVPCSTALHLHPGRSLSTPSAPHSLPYSPAAQPTQHPHYSPAALVVWDSTPSGVLVRS